MLREVLAGYLRRVRAAAASPARMIISTGFAQGINLVLRTLGPGAHVDAAPPSEYPGYGSAQADETVRAALGDGPSTSPTCRLTGFGLFVPASWPASGAQAVVVTAAHQSPTGVVLSPAGGGP